MYRTFPDKNYINFFQQIINSYSITETETQNDQKVLARFFGVP